MRGLTERQQMIFDFIVQHIKIHLMPPTNRAICDHMGITSTNGAADHLKALQRKGYIIIKNSLSRGIYIPVEKRVEYGLVFATSEVKHECKINFQPAE